MKDVECYKDRKLYAVNVMLSHYIPVGKDDAEEQEQHGDDNDNEDEEHEDG